MPNVLVDNTGQSTGGTSTTSLTISSFAVGSGVDRCIYLGVSQYAATDQVPSATFNGSENFVVHDQVTIAESPGTRRVTILKLPNPSNVTASIVVSWGGTVNEAVVGADSWTTVNQAAPFGTAVKNSGSAGGAATSSVVVPNAAGDVVHDTISADGASGVSGTANQTSRWNAVAATNTTDGAGQSADGAGTNITSTWTSMGSPGGTIFAHIGVAIQVSSGTAAIPVGFDPRTKSPPGMPGPRDRLGFLRQQIWESTISVPAPSTVAQAAASIAMSTAFAVGVAIFSGTGVTTAQSEAQAPATGIAAGAGVSVSQATGSAGSAPTGAGSGASTAQSLARGTGAPTGAGGGCTTAQSTASAVGSPTGAGAGISSGVGAICIAVGQAVVPGVGGVTVAQSTVVGAGAPIGAGGGCTTSIATARGTGISIAAGAGVSVSASRGVAASTPTGAGVGISLSPSVVLGSAVPPITIDAAGLILIPNDGRLTLAPNDGRLFLTPNNGALSLVPNDGTLSLIPDS